MPLARSQAATAPSASIATGVGVSAVGAGAAESFLRRSPLIRNGVVPCISGQANVWGVFGWDEQGRALKGITNGAQAPVSREGLGRRGGRMAVVRNCGTGYSGTSAYKNYGKSKGWVNILLPDKVQAGTYE